MLRGAVVVAELPREKLPPDTLDSLLRVLGAVTRSVLRVPLGEKVPLRRVPTLLPVLRLGAVVELLPPKVERRVLLSRVPVARCC